MEDQVTFRTVDLLELAVRFAYDPSDWLVRRNLQAALANIYVALDVARDGDEAAYLVLNGEFPRERAESAFGGME